MICPSLTLSARKVKERSPSPTTRSPAWAVFGRAIALVGSKMSFFRNHRVRVMSNQRYNDKTLNSKPMPIANLKFV